MPLDIGSIIGSAVSLYNGIQNRDATRENNERLMQDAALNRKLQMDFAEGGIGMKVRDALANGIHPLAALGASTTSYSPVSVGTSAEKLDLGDFGQNIGRALNSTMSANDRGSAASKAAEALTLERGSLENELLKTKIASATATLQQAGGNPAMPIGDRHLIDGQGSAVVPEKKKFDERPQLQYGGRKILTDPATSNVESAEDRYGDEGPAQWAAQMATAWNDFKYNVNRGNFTREDFARIIGDNAKFIASNAKELKGYLSPARTLFGRR